MGGGRGAKALSSISGDGAEALCTVGANSQELSKEVIIQISITTASCQSKITLTVGQSSSKLSQYVSLKASLVGGKA